jgi:hypothetical protein
MYGAPLSDEEIWQAWYPGWCHKCGKQQPQTKSFSYFFSGKTECKVCCDAMVREAGIAVERICREAQIESEKTIAALNAQLKSTPVAESKRVGFWAWLRRG